MEIETALATLTVDGLGSASAVSAGTLFRALKLFADTIEGTPLIGWIGEVIIFDYKLTQEQVRVIQNYLEDRWIGTGAKFSSFDSGFGDDFS